MGYKRGIEKQPQLPGVAADPAMIVAEEAEILEDLIIAAYHDAKVKLDQKQAETMQSAMGDMQLPEGMKLPF